MGLGGATGAQWIVAVVDGPCERPQAGPHANGLDVLAQSVRRSVQAGRRAGERRRRRVHPNLRRPGSSSRDLVLIQTTAGGKVFGPSRRFGFDETGRGFQKKQEQRQDSGKQPSSYHARATGTVKPEGIWRGPPGQRRRRDLGDHEEYTQKSQAISCHQRLGDSSLLAGLMNSPPWCAGGAQACSRTKRAALQDGRTFSRASDTAHLVLTRPRRPPFDRKYLSPPKGHPEGRPPTPQPTPELDRPRNAFRAPSQGALLAERALLRSLQSRRKGPTAICD